MGEVFGLLDTWSAYIITAYEQAEQYIGRKADKNRKLYNGMMKTYIFSIWDQSHREKMYRCEER